MQWKWKNKPRYLLAGGLVIGLLTGVVLAAMGGVLERDEKDNDETGDDPGLDETAAEIRDRFAAWLETNYPELGITTETEWTETSAKPLVGCSYYVFSSQKWEMGLQWVVCAPGYDWARIYLKHTDETERSYGFEISSLFDAEQEPHPIDPPQWVW